VCVFSRWGVTCWGGRTRPRAGSLCEGSRRPRAKQGAKCQPKRRNVSSGWTNGKSHPIWPLPLGGWSGWNAMQCRDWTFFSLVFAGLTRDLVWNSFESGPRVHGCSLSQQTNQFLTTPTRPQTCRQTTKNRLQSRMSQQTNHMLVHPTLTVYYKEGEPGAATGGILLPTESGELRCVLVSRYGPFSERKSSP
jgi:hypothetical protein